MTFPDIFMLDVEGAKAIASATLLLWGMGFAIRTVIRALREADDQEKTD